MKDSQALQFVDTNILVYAHDLSAGTKHERAKQLMAELWHHRTGCLSLQVLQEFYVTVTQKVMKPLDPAVAAEAVSALASWQVHVPNVSDVLEAIRVQQRNRLSFWDSLIVCSAKSLGCQILWTEDFSHGQHYEGVKALNPFF